jgi:hypothetical protein
MSYRPKRERWHTVKSSTFQSRYWECAAPGCLRVTRMWKDMPPLIHKGKAYRVR